MKTFLLIATAVTTIAISAIPVDAKSKHHRSYYSTYAEAYVEDYAPAYERRARRLMRQVETHDTVRANSADPTHQYDLPDWARAALAGRGGRR